MTISSTVQDWLAWLISFVLLALAAWQSFL